ncbi:amidohydrolase family protein [Nocardia africana]|uniref:Predicted metal-dependent hydrolase of the TIM-barrel fold n=1 Tax=Nocardia africana TaxID=134964 RepID=A0A378WYT4_9NOCA|nr:amidohydrolase family protein [Nocardia africana]MCC3312301.1 amidohydrolase family protein [Nocardia africana]SUA46388.1 Predicted metal-dependent hydrolase of the TIM-barrel fold [Nocardia africana]
MRNRVATPTYQPDLYSRAAILDPYPHYARLRVLGPAVWLAEQRVYAAGFALPRALPALMRLVGPDRLLYGSDFPFTPDWAVQGLAEALASTTVLKPSEHRLMLRDNALALFPRLRSPHIPEPETAS